MILPSSQYHVVIMPGDVGIIPDDVNLIFFNEINTIVTYNVEHYHDKLTTLGTVILPSTHDNLSTTPQALSWVSGNITILR